MELENSLQKFFGYSHFRPTQKNIITSVIQGRNTLAILPTGGGKSICFQLPGLILGGTTIVISPLISLMKDQVETLLRKGISATFINSSLNQLQIEFIYSKARQGAYKFIYIAPERLQDKKFRKLCQQLDIKLVAVDESHCISEWGLNFRPLYRKIPDFIETLPLQPAVMALTATATPLVQRDIITNLNFKNPSIFTTSFRRKNLRLQVIHCQTYQEQLIQILARIRHSTTSSIVYTATRQKTVQWAQYFNYLSGKTIARAYHGALSVEKKDLVQQEFFSNKVKIIVATSAFGMGIDKGDIYNVFHLDPALSLEEFYQEVGRAGRDGKVSDCILLAQPHSATVLQHLTHSDDPVQTHHLQLKLQSMLQYIISKQCRSQFILKYFGEDSENCQLCDNCCPLSIVPDELKSEVRHIRATVNRQLGDRGLNFTRFLTPAQLVFVSLLKPQTPQQFLKIPGIGTGWITQWYQHLEPHFETLYTQRMVQ